MLVHCFSGLAGNWEDEIEVEGVVVEVEGVEDVVEVVVEVEVEDEEKEGERRRRQSTRRRNHRRYWAVPFHECRGWDR